MGVQRLRSMICTGGIRFDSITHKQLFDSIRFDSMIVSGRVERFDSERFAFDCRLLAIMKFIDKAMRFKDKSQNCASCSAQILNLLEDAGRLASAMASREQSPGTVSLSSVQHTQTNRARDLEKRRSADG